MKINKEKEVNTEIHKKRTGKIHKKNETKNDNQSREKCNVSRKNG